MKEDGGVRSLFIPFLKMYKYWGFAQSKANTGINISSQITYGGAAMNTCVKGGGGWKNGKTLAEAFLGSSAKKRIEQILSKYKGEQKTVL